jgi:hypothetical protein
MVGSLSSRDGCGDEGPVGAVGVGGDVEVGAVAGGKEAAAVCSRSLLDPGLAGMRLIKRLPVPVPVPLPVPGAVAEAESVGVALGFR